MNTNDSNDKKDSIDYDDRKRYTDPKSGREEENMPTEQIVARKMSVREQKPNPKSVSNEWITTGQAAKLLGVSSVNTVKRWVKEGKLEARQLKGKGGWIFINRNSVEALLQKNDPHLRHKQRLHEGLTVLDELLGDGELTEEEMKSLSMKNYGKLPWEK